MEEFLINKFNSLYLEAIFKVKNRQSEIFYGIVEEFNDNEKYKIWYWKYLSNQLNVNWNVVKNNPLAKWNYKLMSLNENINLNIIKNYPDKEWDYELYCSNINFKIEDKNQIPKFSIYQFSKNPNFTYQNLLNYKNKILDWSHISSSKILNINFIRENLDKNWNWFNLSENQYLLNFETYIQNQDLPWLLNGITQNKNFSFEQLKSINQNISYSLYSNNENINWDLLIEDPYQEWEWEFLSKNKSLDWKIIKDNFDYPWSWYELSKNPNIKLEIIFENKDLPWVWEEVSKHPKLDPNLVLDNLDISWNPIGLIFNDMKYSKNKYISNKLKKYCTNILTKTKLPEDIIYYINLFI